MDDYWIHSYTNNTGSEGVTDPSGGRSNDYFDDFKQFIDDDVGGGWGVHLGVTNQTKYAEAEHAYVDYNAWGYKTKAYVGIKGGYDVTNEDKERYQNLAIQETLHNMCIQNIYHDSSTGDEDLLEPRYPDDHMAEHQLGWISSDYSTYADSSPMITYYEHGNAHPVDDNAPDLTGDGACSTSISWDENHTQQLTNCTEDAVDYTTSYLY